MKSKLHLLLLAVLLAISLLLPGMFLATAAPDAPSAPTATGGLTAAPLIVENVVGSKAGTEPWSYIIRLAGEPLATYRGGVPRLQATSPQVTGQPKLNVRSPASQAYLSYLAEQQNRFITQMAQVLGHPVKVLHTYKVTYNGIAAVLTPAEAARVAKMKGVVSVQRDELKHILTDVTPEFIGATQIWDATAAGLSPGNKFDAVLSGDNAVPPVETDATGLATFTYDPDTRVLSYTLGVSNIVSVTMAHIHRGETGVSGPVAYWLYDPSGERAPGGDFPVSGTVTITEDDADLLMSAGLYVNVHTEAHPAGEIRGQIMPLGTKGEGVIVGVVDTGVWPEHPSFADDGTYPEPPEEWGGDCTPPEGDDYTCNNKLIGIQYSLNTYDAVLGYDGLFLSGRDDDGHGTHTASTAAGNENVEVTLLGVDRGTISGIAPRAHVATYKACGPRGCFTSDLVAAIDEAVADGVDVINFSIGGGAANPWEDANSLAFLAARAAGVFAATSAGNSGPGPETVGSPGNAPWIATVGASTSNRHFISEITLSGPGEPPTGLWGASLTAGVTDFNLVDAEGIPDSEGETSGRCLNPFPEGTFQPNDVVLCRRGVVARVSRGDYVQAGGGGGVILYNPTRQGLATDNYVIPAVHVENDVGQQIKDYITAHPGEVTVSFTPGTAVFGPEDPRIIPDMMADFSSRGPNGPVPAVIKPDVTAPGVQILAGASPEHVNPDAQGELFQAIQGTSMSSPHMAGAGALLKALYPDWTPAEIQSALMTTAKEEGVVKEDGETPADPFDVGGGRIDLSRATDPGLVFDVTTQEYEAGRDDPANINLPSLGYGKVAGEATITRTATSLVPADTTWTVSVEAPEGVEVTVTPDTLVVPANGMATFQVTVNVVDQPFGWYFADLDLLHGPHQVHMPIAFEAVSGFWSSLEGIKTQFDAGRTGFELQSGVNLAPFVVNSYGLVDPVRTAGGPLDQDPDQDADTDPLGEGFQLFTYTLGSDVMWFVAQTRDSEIRGIDLYLLYDANGDGVFRWPRERIDADTSPDPNKEVQVQLPAPGNYLVAVHAWAGSGTYTLKTYQVTTAAEPSMDVLNVPGSLTALESYQMQLAWDHPIDQDEEYLGLVTMGSAEDPTFVGLAPVRIIGDVPAVQKMASLNAVFTDDWVDYEVRLANTAPVERAMSLVDTLPTNMTVDPTSITGGAMLTDGTITWSGSVPPGGLVTIGPSTTHFGYVSLAELGIEPLDIDDPNLDDTAVNFRVAPVSYLGKEYEVICMVTNGYLVMGGCTSTADIAFKPQQFPDPTLPNNVIAPLWMDFDLDGGDGVGGGTWYAARLTDGVRHWRVFEWENAQRWGETGTAFTFQVWLQEETEEVTLTYARLDGPTTKAAVGAENDDGTNGATYYFNDGEGTEVGTLPTVEDILDVAGGPSFHTITYRAQAVAEGEATNVATTTSGASRDTDSATVTVTELPPPPSGRYSLSARVFLDSRCDTFFLSGQDRALAGVPVTLSFSNRAMITHNTSNTGLVLFSGFDVTDPVTLTVELPAEYRGWTLDTCPYSATSMTLLPADFGSFRSRFVIFGARVTGEGAGP